MKFGAGPESWPGLRRQENISASPHSNAASGLSSGVIRKCAVSSTSYRGRPHAKG